MIKDSDICIGAEFKLFGNDLWVRITCKGNGNIKIKDFRVSHEHNLQLDSLIKEIYKSSKNK